MNLNMNESKRIILISDKSGETESIIPWGLNLGKHTGSEVDILHIIDPRDKQGVESPESDSRSITPGEKLKQDEILDREKGKAELALEKLLSKEASRLNYPLKINRIIETGQLEEVLKSFLGKRHGSVLVTSSEPEGTVFTDPDELLSVSRDLTVPVFIVPPGTDFEKPEKVFMLADYSESPGLEMKNILKWLSHFSPLLSAGEVVEKMNQFVKLELAGKTWEKGVKKYIDPGITLKTNQLKGKSYTEAVINYVDRNKFHWIVLPKSKKESSKKIFSADISKKLVESIDKPILLY